MNIPEEQYVPPDASEFPGGLPALHGRIAALRSRLGESPESQAVIAELETAYEALWVADEEVRTQQAEIRRLSDSHQLMQWRHQRMLEMLPVPGLTTDLSGLIRFANAAAAELIGARLPSLLRKPVYSFFSAEDRPVLRTQLSTLGAGGRLRRTVTMHARDGRVLLVEVRATTASTEVNEITWILLASGGDSFGVPRGEDLPGALVRLAGLTASGRQEVDLLRDAASICQDALGDQVTLSINSGPPSAPAALASTSTVAQGVDGAQLACDQGPCVTAFDERRTVVSSNLRSDPRWPDLAADPRTSGAGGVVAVPLAVGDELLGALNVYGDVGDPPDTRLVESANLLAAAVAAVFHELEARRELELVAADMERALASRAIIDQAKGIVMADRGCSADEAFRHLVELSSRQHVKLRDLARQLVEQRSTGEGVVVDRNP